jgi:hypothetical protein
MLGGCLGSGDERTGLLFDGPDQILNRFYFRLFEEGLPTLFADPGWDVIEREMAPLPINVQRRGSSLHAAAIMNAFHFFNLTLKSADHSSFFGMYAVIIAKYSSFGEHTTWIGRFSPYPRRRQLWPLGSSG